MKQAQLPLFCAGILLFGAAAANELSPPKSDRALFSLWARISTPLKAESKPIGNYSAGCLAGARTLPLDGKGYSVMRPSRRRYFGHPLLVSYIEDLGTAMSREKLRQVKLFGLPESRKWNGRNHRSGLFRSNSNWRPILFLFILPD